MSFISIQFLGFLLVIVVLSSILKGRLRLLLWNLAGLFFLGSGNPESIVVILLGMIVTFGLVSGIQNVQSEKFRKTLYRSGVILNIALILVSKYFEKSGTGVQVLFSDVNFKLDNLIVAIGVSFYSLQNIAFITDVFFRRISGTISLTSYTSFTLFFPKLVSGPIEQVQEFDSQLSEIRIHKEKIISGLQKVILGFVKKMVIADRLAPYIIQHFETENTGTGIVNLIIAYLFTIQLYFDFSAYTDIAVGSAKMLGINLKENFNLPLRAKSVTEFWRCWHISLTSWLTKYVFYPLSYRVRNIKTIGVLLALFVTFLISGFWHGIGFTFIIYATSHAIYLIIEHLTKRRRLKWKERIPGYGLIGTIITFNLVSFSFIFFRAGDLTTAFQFAGSIFNPESFFPDDWRFNFLYKLTISGDLEDLFNFFITLLLPTVFLIYEQKINRMATSESLKVPFIVVSVIVILLFGVFVENEHFIYNQF